MHVIVDGFGGDPEQLSDENVVRAVLDQYPQEMGMTKIAPPIFKIGPKSGWRSFFAAEKARMSSGKTVAITSASKIDR